MNLLAHAFFSGQDAEIMVGNVIADFIKGTAALAALPHRVQLGVRLHRAIDEFSDKHGVSMRAKNLFRQDYRLYSGAIVDVVYDHYLANDPAYFDSEKSLLIFCHKVYETLHQFQEILPHNFGHMLTYMERDNWLYNYRSMKGMERGLERLQHRAKYMPPSKAAYQTFVGNYYQLNQYYYEFIEDLIFFIKDTLSTLAAPID